MVPASELPIWKAHYQDEPWGYDAADYLQAKNAYYTSTRLREGTTVSDLIDQSPYDNLSLTPEQFEALDEDEQKLYSQRLVNRAKASIH